MSIRFSFFILIITLASDVTAKNSDAASRTAVSARDTLERFNATQEFIGSSRDIKAARYQLASHCEGAPINACIDYLQQNQQAIQDALPNNPEYWRIFHELINGPSLKWDFSLKTLNDPRADTSRLIETSFYWLYHIVAEDNVSDSVDKFIHYYRGVRRQMSESVNLSDRMSFIALVGIAHWEIEILMALLAADGDIDSIRKLSAELTAFSLEERSLRNTFKGEANFIAASIENIEEINPDYFRNSQYVPKGTSSETKQWLVRAGRHESEQGVAFIGEVTERNWSDYWEQGFSHMETEFPGNAKPVLFDVSAYLDYAVTARSSEVPIYPLLALSDVYLGLSSPGLPARTAPPYWTWSWNADQKQICLVPTHVAANSTQFSIENPACVTLLASF